MPTLFFRKACTVLLNDEERTAHGADRFFFDIGRHDDVPADIAEKPYVQAHLGTDKDVRAAVPAANSPTTGTGGEAALAAMTAERDEALERAEKAEASLMDALNALSAEQAAHAETQKLLEDATAPKDQSDISSSGEGASEPDETVGDYTVRRGYQGTYKVLKGEQVLAEGLSKADAEAKAAEMKAQG